MMIADTILIDLPTENQLLNFSERLALAMTPPKILTFSGEIGAGKTTLIRALLRRIGINDKIKSPTFSLVESYQLTAAITIHHFDLYRIHDISELDDLGFRDYFTENAICLIEWPERGLEYINHVDLAVSLLIKGQGRTLQIVAQSDIGMATLKLIGGV